MVYRENVVGAGDTCSQRRENAFGLRRTLRQFLTKEFLPQVHAAQFLKQFSTDKRACKDPHPSFNWFLHISNEATADGKRASVLPRAYVGRRNKTGAILIAFVPVTLGTC